MGGSNNELQEPTDRLSNIAWAYGIEVSSEKSKVIVNCGVNTAAQVSMKG